MVIGLLFDHFDGYSQSPVLVSAYFDRITTAEGLSYDKVRAILQDHIGFVWIGTTNGLNRFDGHRFKVFANKVADSASIPDNRITQLFEDSKQVLWICTFAGVSRYNPVTEKFENFFLKDKTDAKTDISCYDIKEVNNQYWVATSRGLRRLNLFSRTIESFVRDTDTSFINSVVCYNLVADQQKNLWVATFNGLLKINTIDFRYEHILLDDGIADHKVANNQLAWLAADDEKHLWIGTWSGGLKKFNKYTRKFSTYLWAGSAAYNFLYNVVRTILPSSRDNRYLWISGAGEGLFRFDKITCNFIPIVTAENPSDKKNSPIRTFSLFEDRSGRLWCGGEEGILIVDPNRQSVVQKQLSLNLEQDCLRDISAIYEDPISDGGKTYWISTWTCGIFKTDSNFSSLTRIQSLFSFPDSIRSANCIFRDSRNNLWLSCGLRGLFRIEGASGKVNRLSTRMQDELSSPTYRKIVQDGRGTIWIGSNKGLYFTDDPGRFIKKFDHPVLAGAAVADIEIDNSGKIWVLLPCGDSGEPLLYRIDQNSHSVTAPEGNFSRFFTCMAQKPAVDFYIDTNDIVWLASHAGLIRAEDKSGKLRLTVYSNLSPSGPVIVNRISPFDQNNLWLSSSQGLLLFDTKDKKVRKRFSRKDGLLNFDSYLVYADSRKNIYLEGKSGSFNIIKTRQLEKDELEPKVLLTGIKILNGDYTDSVHPVYELRELSLKYPNNHIRFEFATLNFKTGAQQQFAYQLEGIDKDWILSSQPFSVYNHLAGGKYLFRVKACNDEGIWGNTETKIILRVLPPFWQNIWFKTGVALLFASIIFGVIKRRIYLIRKEAEWKQQRAMAETKALRAQMNPHFIFNCLNTIDAYILKNKQEEASDILQKFSELIRRVLENSRHEKVPIEDEVKLMEIYIELEEYILGNSFDHTVFVEPLLLERPYTIPSLLLQPYIENAILHGLRHRENQGGRLLVDLRLKDQRVLCTIQDNGIGRKRSNEINRRAVFNKESLGMKVMNERIEYLNSVQKEKIKVIIEDGFNDIEPGTKVEISFPAEQMPRSHDKRFNHID